MGDGSRRLDVTLTGAQYDVLLAAIAEVVGRWDRSTPDRSSNVGTLLRAQGRIVEAWMEGIRA